MHDVVIEAGSLDRIRQHLPIVHSYVIICDSNVSDLYGRRLTSLIPSSHLLSFPFGEAHKTRETWQRITDQMLELRIARDTCVIAVGGGVTCDLAGFVAATYMRGVPVVQVPTSLLAMIDAAIGGKTGVDVPAGKNLVGAFHPPLSVLIDPTVLGTLPDAELSNGLAEAIKHGAIADRAYLEWITESSSSIFERRVHTLESLIRRSVEIKSEFVEGDLREAGKRAALNFGHTIGHALERVSSYKVQHGHAVAIGMLVEANIGNVLGVTNAETSNDIYNALQRARLPHEIALDEVAPLLTATSSDKKVRDGAVRYVLLERTGRVARTPAGEWTWEVPDAVIRDALRPFSV
jgi:3-dehydroquinate synthase